MQIQTTKPFDRDYARLPEGVKERVDKQLALLHSNPCHPSLRLKKMRGTEEIWEARITRSYRMTLQIAAAVAILRRVGTHSILDAP